MGIYYFFFLITYIAQKITKFLFRIKMTCHLFLRKNKNPSQHEDAQTSRIKVQKSLVYKLNVISLGLTQCHAIGTWRWSIYNLWRSCICSSTHTASSRQRERKQWPRLLRSSSSDVLLAQALQIPGFGWSSGEVKRKRAIYSAKSNHKLCVPGFGWFSGEVKRKRYLQTANNSGYCKVLSLILILEPRCFNGMMEPTDSPLLVQAIKPCALMLTCTVRVRVRVRFIYSCGTLLRNSWKIDQVSPTTNG